MKTLLAMVALLVGVSSYAQTSSSTSSTSTADSSATSKSSAQELTTKQPADPNKDIDNEITNAKMRADTGSKSKHSFSFEGAYSGGTVKNVFGKERPNIVAGGNIETKTALSADLSYRYRLSASDSITAGVGLKWLTPSYEGQKMEASNPGVGYSRAYKIGKVQNITSFSFTKYTAEQLIRAYKSNFVLGMGHTALAEIGTSGWQLGLATDVYYNNYTEYVKDNQSEFGVGLYPFLEYVFNDTYNFRTVFRGTSFESARETPMTFVRSEPTQSMGLGIAATRDIFLYPNIQWTWHHPNADRTNVALSATMNFL